MPLTVPKYRDLPVQANAPPGSAWGVFDRNGKKDVYGTLNFITREAVVAARQEIQTGESVTLNLPLHLPHQGCPGRVKLDNHLIEGAHGFACCDDELHLNTQASSQWDGLLHWAHQERREYYNGVAYDDAAKTRTDISLGVQSLSERGGVVARGILLDFVRYADKRGIKYDPIGYYPITLTHIKEMIEEEGLTVKQGDVLVVRTGLSKYIRNSSPDAKENLWGGRSIGVDPTPEFLEWLWDSNIGAVASDAVAFECCPASDDSRMRFHTAALPGWGMPIGELFDLEALAAVAEKEKRWSFFLTYCPLNLEGGAASIANTLAIF